MLKLLILALATALVYSQDASTSPSCDGAIDLGFIVDSSSSVGADNFQMIRDFMMEVVGDLSIANNLTRVSIARYTSWTDSILFFNTLFDKEAILELITTIPYYGRGTRTAQALNVFANHHLQAYSGWREGAVPTVNIIVTDGKTQDADMLEEYARNLRAKSTRVIAIGVGKADEDELNKIATEPAEENVILVSDFTDLSGRVNDIVNAICDAVDDINECLADNGGCDQVCVNTYDSFYCECQSGSILGSDGASCSDIDECLELNGGCSHVCDNQPGTFECSCPDGYILTANGKTCVVNSCLTDENDCEQICNNVVNGDLFCSCNPGYKLGGDKKSCDDVDECAINDGGCEVGCNNTMGGYTCTCQEGYGLREDGRTCGLMCYYCNRALSNTDCLNLVICSPNQKSCQTETRRENGVLLISKQCKQTEACVNNFIQNPRTAASPSQCNVEGDGSSVCRCCCHGSLCNSEGACSTENTVDIECENPFVLFGENLVSGVDIVCTGFTENQVGDTCAIVCPEGLQVVTGSNELVCSQRPRTLSGVWMGEVGTCGDIDECSMAKGGCSHFCTNTNGSFSCSCPVDNSCESQPLDLYVILDSSSSVGQENFNAMIDFVINTVSLFIVGQNDTRVGVMTYNRQTNKRFDLKDIIDNDDFISKMREIEYAGRGTRTAHAISTAARDCFVEGRGRRPEVPLAVMIVTDGRSNDAHRLPEAVNRLHAQADEVFAIGVSDRVNENELLQIANGDVSNYRMVETFGELDNSLVMQLTERFCTEPENTHSLASDLLTCDFDECSVANGGCSHNCTNTLGSYFCSCPEGMSVTEDRLTCDDNECIFHNGGCEQGCVSKLGKYNCLCGNGKTLGSDGTSCIDFDECSDDNGGCSDVCVNLTPGYRCECNEGFVLSNDGETCEPDSCFDQVSPMACAQNCVNIPGGSSFMCTCDEGYSLQEDGYNCTEIDECLFSNGGCEYVCINTPGSYQCECPPEMALRDDMKTCGISCYQCNDVLSNEECDTVVACGVSQDSCFATMRIRNNVTRITKGCKQRTACINNLIQNPRDQGEGPSQCNTNSVNSKCECCCVESGCNAGLCPYSYILSGCPTFERTNVVFSGLQSPEEVSPGGVAKVTCPTGLLFEQNGAIPTQLNCNYNFSDATSAWDGDVEDLDVCIDVNECDINNGGCIFPATCVNLEGSFECVCPDEPADYQLIDGVICERDECAAPDQGGCSHNCTNIVPGYVCFCPGGMSLVEDGLTCDPDECQDGNAGCAEICINIMGGFECRCREGRVIAADGSNCVDINECEISNGGCSHVCTNLEPGYECSCPESMLLEGDGFTCRSNPCFENNGGCGQICRMQQDGSVQCSCSQGYLLLDDGSCLDIDECSNNNAGCKYNCTNFDGGFTCECPIGQALHQDGRTCGPACYSCVGAETNEECNAQPLQICQSDADACENEVRVHNGKKRIYKRCKQALSCSNNFMQNPRTAFDATQCNGQNGNDVCRCCCSGHLCNFHEKPCQAEERCNVDRADVAIILDSSSSVKFDNFQIMKSFARSIFSTFNLGEGKVHSALIRYNNQVDKRFDFKYSNDADDVADVIDAIPYNGRGTRTGNALTFLSNVLFKESNGARLDVPMIAITITDGRSQDDVTAPSERLRAEGVITYAIGIGRINNEQLVDIAGDQSRLFIADDFTDLGGLVLTNIQQAVCHDIDECDTNNGGCSHTCTNTQGSFKCSCPEDEGLILGIDLRSCQQPDGTLVITAIDECADNNGGCSDDCVDSIFGFNCTCSEGRMLGEDMKTCLDVNECEVENGECSHNCVDNIGSHFCECPEDYEIDEDLKNCNMRPGEANCPVGYQALGHSCMRLTSEAGIYSDAEADCAATGGRLVKIDDMGILGIVAKNFPRGSWIGLSDRAEEGAWIHSDGTALTFTDGWADDQPAFGDCAQIKEYFKTDRCTRERQGICEIARLDGFMVFSRTWANGAQGKLYFPTDANMVLVSFPKPVRNFNVWFGSVSKQINSRQFVVSQNDIERQSSNGQAEYVVDMRNQRFADYQCTVEPYTPTMN